MMDMWIISCLGSWRSIGDKKNEKRIREKKDWATSMTTSHFYSQAVGRVMDASVDAWLYEQFWSCLSERHPFLTRRV